MTDQPTTFAHGPLIITTQPTRTALQLNDNYAQATEVDGLTVYARQGDVTASFTALPDDTDHNTSYMLTTVQVTTLSAFPGVHLSAQVEAGTLTAVLIRLSPLLDRLARA